MISILLENSSSSRAPRCKRSSTSGIGIGNYGIFGAGLGLGNSKYISENLLLDLFFVLWITGESFDIVTTIISTNDVLLRNLLLQRLDACLCHSISYLLEHEKILLNFIDN